MDRSDRMNYRTYILVVILSLVCSLIILFNKRSVTLLLGKTHVSSWLTISKRSQIGEWKTGLRYNQTCQLADSTLCCRRTVRQLHFVFKDNSLNRDDVLDLFKTKMSRKIITIFGDSMQGYFFRYLVEILNMGEKITNKKYFGSNFEPKSKVHLQLGYFYEYETYLCQKDRNTGKKVMRKNTLLKVISESDIIIFNLGLHYFYCNVSTYKAALEEVAGLLKEELTRNPYKQVVFRSTLPQHFYMGTNIGGYSSGFNKSAKCFGENHVEHYTNKYMKEVSKRYGFKYLDSFPIYAARWDLHFPNNKRPDCTHFCYTAEIVIPELALLEQLLSF